MLLVGDFLAMRRLLCSFVMACTTACSLAKRQPVVSDIIADLIQVRHSAREPGFVLDVRHEHVLNAAQEELLDDDLIDLFLGLALELFAALLDGIGLEVFVVPAPGEDQEAASLGPECGDSVMVKGSRVYENAVLGCLGCSGQCVVGIRDIGFEFFGVECEVFVNGLTGFEDGDDFGFSHG
jgi:hypothetical protein